MLNQIVITAGARLHFGFFAHRQPAAPDNTEASEASPGGLLERSNFGGIGMMIDTPAFVVAASKSNIDCVTCSAGTRDVDLARTVSTVTRLVARYRRTCPPDRRPPPCSIEVRKQIPSHSGLGSGTQLAMAVAQTLALMAGDGQADATSLAIRVARGKRSAIGIHGFARGGFLVDGGKRTENEIGRLVARADVPAEWRWLLITPPDLFGTGLSGEEEVNALARLTEMPLSLTERLCRLTVLEIIPALARSDCDWFGEALFQFGRSVGDYFRPVQGGQYADPRMADLVDWLRSSGTRGVAQTSWGPTIAVCCPNLESAESSKSRILADGRWKSCQAQIVSSLNTGAAIQL